MIKQVPLSAIFHDTVMGGPSYNGIEDDTLVSEGTIGRISDGITEEVSITCGVREIIFALIFMHPLCLEEAVRVASTQRLTIFVEDNYREGSLDELEHVVE